MELGKKEGNYTPAFSMCMMPADMSGHVKIEVDIEIAAEIFAKFIDISYNKTSIWVSHRLSVCKMVDRIFVIDQGEIVASGSHNKLISQSDIYKRLYSEQAKHYVTVNV